MAITREPRIKKPVFGVQDAIASPVGEVTNVDPYGRRDVAWISFFVCAQFPIVPRGNLSQLWKLVEQSLTQKNQTSEGDGC